MITTEGGKTEVIKALKAGVNNYIVKPFTPQVLKEKISAILGV
jgi:two-component system chemotaxis response regulator CheY